ncbi:MAG: hypothetical protein IPK22_13775 [Verrucomicrobiaceae bacterium]|nr:hypothetical protein [Verrucomicrobiaceae bacterium]
MGSAASFGSLEVNAGSSVTVSSTISVVSPSSGLSSSLVVDGIGSKLTAGFDLFLDAGGTVQLRNGATVDSILFVSRSLSGRAAQTLIEGAGTVFDAGRFYFYGDGTSEISVTNGATLSSVEVQILNNSSNFSFTVGGGSGTSQWLATGVNTFGGAGAGLLEVIGGGFVRFGTGILTLGQAPSGSGTIRVDGTDGPAEVDFQVSPRIGASGTGRLVVTNGGKVTTTNGFISIGDSSRGGTGTLSIGGGEKVSSLEGKPALLVSGAASLIEVLANGVINADSIRVTDGARVIVGGSSAAAALNLSPGGFSFPNNGELFVTGGSRVEVRQGGTITATSFSVNDASSQVSLDGGTLKGGGYLGGLPVQVMAGGGTIQAANGAEFTLLATTGPGMLTKTGAGSMAFAGQTNHAGTRVLEGSLNLAAGSRTTGTVEILAGAKLTGTGTLDGLLTLQQGAVIAPGNSPGILQTGSSTWMSGGRYEWEINNTLGNNGINWDLVQINGSLDLVGLSPSDPFVIALQSLFESSGNAGLAANFDSQSNYRFTILTTTSGITGFDPSDFRLDLTGFANADLGDAYWALQDWNNGLDLVYNFAPVPEPGSAIFIAVTALAALTQRRRR